MSTCIFFFNDTATTEIYTLSLHDALPISHGQEDAGRVHDGGQVLGRRFASARHRPFPPVPAPSRSSGDRKSTRLNSSHQIISYAVFCLKKKDPLHQRHRSRDLSLTPHVLL